MSGRLPRQRVAVVAVLGLMGATLLGGAPASAGGPQLAAWNLPTSTVDVGAAGTPTPFQATPLGIATGADGSIWATDASLATLYRVLLGPPVSAASAAFSPAGPVLSGPDGDIWLGSGYGILFQISPSSGSFNRLQVPEGPTVQALAAGPDGNVWSVLNGGAIGRTTPAGRTTVFPAPYNVLGNISGITAGPDGALWFTAATSPPTLGRITTDGTIRTFQAPAGTPALSTGEPSINHDIMAGPDGALWITLTGAIGRMSTSGQFQTFPLLDATLAPQGIVSGPDGALWFLEETATERLDPNAFGLPELGADGLGRITPAGIVTDVPVRPSAPTAFGDMTVGPDKNLWFTEVDSGKVVRFTPSGVLALGSVPSLPAGTVGLGYTATVVGLTAASPAPPGAVVASDGTWVNASGGTPPYTWSVRGLPPGLAYDASSGEITGTPTTVGTYQVTEAATDSASPPEVSYVTVPLTVSAAPVPVVSGVSPTRGATGGGTEVSITGTGFAGATAVDFGPNAAPWLQVDPSGTSITTQAPAGTGTVDVTVTGPGGTSAADRQADGFTYVVPLAIATTSLPAGTVGQSYSATLQATDGSGPVTWAVVPQCLRQCPGQSGGGSYSGGLPPAYGARIVPWQPGSGTAAPVRGGPSVLRLAGRGPVMSDPLPAGLTLDAQGGTITGTPQQAGTFSLAIQATDGAGDQVSTVLPLTIQPAASTSTTQGPTPAPAPNPPAPSPSPQPPSVVPQPAPAPPAGEPVVTGIEPAGGPDSGGATVTITGSNLTGASSVAFGDFGQARILQIAPDGTSMQVSTPQAWWGDGPVYVQVTTPRGTSAVTSASQYTYRVPRGPARGGGAAG